MNTVHIQSLSTELCAGLGNLAQLKAVLMGPLNIRAPSEIFGPSLACVAPQFLPLIVSASFPAFQQDDDSKITQQTNGSS